MSKATPFLTRPTDGAVRSFAAALPSRGGPVADSPWTPRVAAAPAAAPQIDPQMIAAAREAAVADGRAAGLAETDALRAKLRALVAQLEQATAAKAEQLAEKIADAAVASVEAWLGRADGADKLAPVIRGWIGATGDGGGASARCHPSDADGLRAAIGDAKINLVEDATVTPGDVHLATSTLELSHDWKARLAELRHAIAAAYGDAP